MCITTKKSYFLDLLTSTVSHVGADAASSLSPRFVHEPVPSAECDSLVGCDLILNGIWIAYCAPVLAVEI
ncbi:MAG: hypothetical protein ACRCXT_00060, partial [Paraclostridium sp.]